MTAAKVWVTMASIASGTAIVVCLLSVGYLLHDISSFHADSLQHFDEFKVCISIRFVYFILI